MLDHVLLRQEIPEGESSVIRVGFDGHGASARAVLFNADDEAVEGIMHLADF